MRKTKQALLKEIRAIRADHNNYEETVVRADPYKLVAERMLEKVPNSAIFEGMSHKEVRTYCKKPLMTALYNSRAQPEEAFGEDTQELIAFYDTLAELFPGAMNVMEALNNRWDDEATYHEWTLPDGHVAHCKVMNNIDGTLEIEGLNLPFRFKENSPSTVHTSLAPNFVHSLDGYILRFITEKANEEGFQVVHIHDEIQTHPNNMHRVKELYREAIASVATSGILEQYCEQDFGIELKDFLDRLKESS